MNHCAIQQKHAFAACEEMRSSVIFPKPRRIGFLNSAINDPIRPRRWHLSHQTEISDSNEKNGILDSILSKGGGYDIEEQDFTSQPPFFVGSPPCRVANPVIHDTRFLNQITISSSPSTAKSARKGGFVKVNFDNSPAMRVEGFDCLNMDRRNCSISTLA